jgi:hypothetical protein
MSSSGFTIDYRLPLNQLNGMRRHGGKEGRYKGLIPLGAKNDCDSSKPGSQGARSVPPRSSEHPYHIDSHLNTTPYFERMP